MHRLASLLLVLAGLGGCAAPHALTSGAGPAEAVAADGPGASGASQVPRVTPVTGAGARWIDLGLQAGPDGPVLAGRFQAHEPAVDAHRVVLVQGRAADGTLLFERRALAQAVHAEPRSRRDRPASFRLPLPPTQGVVTLTVTVPARSAMN